MDRLIAGRYRLGDRLGRGGMGVVWRARDEILDRDVAVKEVVVPPGLDEADERTINRRAVREARSAGRLSHPGVVTVYDVVEQDGRPWVVMELVRARSLQEVITEDGPMPPRRAARIGRQMLSALGAAHAMGILHRDVKPGNVLIAAGDRAVLTDFGIAVMIGDVTLTQSGGVLGSPAYTAPERIRGERATPASDLWALGVTLHMAVEGRPPFSRTDPVAVFGAVLEDEPAVPRRAGALRPVIAGLLCKDPERRMPADVAGALLKAASGEPAPAVPPAATVPAVPPARGSLDRARPLSTVADVPLGARFPADPPTAPGTPLPARPLEGTVATRSTGPARPRPETGRSFGRTVGGLAYAAAGLALVAAVLALLGPHPAGGPAAGRWRPPVLGTAGILASLAIVHLVIALALYADGDRRPMSRITALAGGVSALCLLGVLVTAPALLGADREPAVPLGVLWAATGVWLGLTGLFQVVRSRVTALAGEVTAGPWILLSTAPTLSTGTLAGLLAVAVPMYGVWAVGVGRQLRRPPSGALPLR